MTELLLYNTLISRGYIFAKADPRLTQDIAYIYEILHCNHFIILSKATVYETTTNHHRAGTPIDCSCLICSGFAETDEVVAGEDFIDVGNILDKSWVSLCVI